MGRGGRSFLLLMVFVSGMTCLGVEMAASRLLAPFFGTSLVIWANLIGMVLLYLTLGYYLGGRLADRYPREIVLYQITAWAAFAIGLLPFISQPILRWSLRGFATFSGAVLVSSLFGVIVLFSIPMILLGCVSPFAIRLAVRDVNTAGNIAGGLYALSTLGSILGTFLPVLLLIPNIGTRNTFLLFSLVLLTISLIGLASISRRRAAWYMPLLAIVVGLMVSFPRGRIKPAEGALYETESAYNYIRVMERGEWRYLELNEELAVHSVYSREHILTGSIWDYFLVAPLFRLGRQVEDVRNLALIGLAAGTVARQYSEVYGPLPIDGVEIDPEIIRVGRQYFDMTEENLATIAQDGRYFLEATNKRYDVVGVDAYQPPYIPFHLTTVEFFALIRAHLVEDGVVAINAGRTATDYSLVYALANTMSRVFPKVYIIDLPAGERVLANSLVVGTRQETTLDDFHTNVQRITHPLLKSVAWRAAKNLSEFQPSEKLPFFTDDRAPVEQLVHRMILRFALEEMGS